MDAVLREIWEASGMVLDPNREPESNLEALHQSHADKPDAERFRSVAHDVFHFHLASQANMYAGWEEGKERGREMTEEEEEGGSRKKENNKETRQEHD